MTTEIERQVRDVLTHQAAAMTPPDLQPGEVLPRPLALAAPPATDRRRAWLGVAAVSAAAAIVAIVGFGGAPLPQTRGSAPTTVPPPASGPVTFDTPRVLLEADALTVDAAGLTFTPTAAVDVNSDPGLWHSYTTLELTWFEHDVEMRIYLYFASDGTDWWASEVRTYDGARSGEWIVTPGERFRTPLGSAYEGDVDLGALHVRGMHLEAFRRPDVCASPTRPIALAGDYRSIALTAGASSGFGYHALLIDTATCTPADASRVVLEASLADPAVAPVRVEVGGVGDLSVGLNADSTPLTPGETTLHVTARNTDTGAVIDEIDVPVIIRAASP